MVLINISNDLPTSVMSKALNKAFDVQKKAQKLSQRVVYFNFPSEKNKDATVKLQCKVHNKIEICSVINYERRKHGMVCCSRLSNNTNNNLPLQNTSNTVKGRSLKNLPSNNEKSFISFLKLKQLLAKRKHDCLSSNGTYAENTFLTLYCKTHKQTFTNVLYVNYRNKKVKYGLPCCTTEAKKRNGLKDVFIANPRDKYVRRAIRLWKKRVVENETTDACAISGVPSTPKTIDSKNNVVQITIQVHHCYGFSHYPSLNFVPQNGICLVKEMHIAYHSFQGGSTHCKNITPTNFISFLEFLLNNISFLYIILVQICENKRYNMTDWLTALKMFDVTSYKKLDLSEMELEKKKSIWLEKPNVNKLLSFIQENIKNLILELKRRDKVLSLYLQDSDYIPEEYKNTFFKK